jgi:hypothetical protein
MAEVVQAPAVAPARAGSRAHALTLAGLGVLAAVLCVDAAMAVDAPVRSDYGLVAVLPYGFWGGLVLLNIVIGAALGRSAVNRPVMGLLQGLLVLVVYGAPVLATGTPRSEVAFRHIGIARQMLEDGRIDASIDAYFSWPGFFAGLGGISEATGVSLETIALVAPVLNGLLFAAGVALVVRTLTSSPQVMWLAVWIFTLTNWIDQDYLSPQAFGFVGYLLAVALMLSVLGAAPGTSLRSAVASGGPLIGLRVWWTSRRPLEAAPRRRVGGLLIVLMIATVVLASHQLTPFMLVAAVAGLVATGRVWSPRLLVILGVLTTLWLTTAASTYLAGHPVLFVGGLGDTAGATITERADGSAAHLQVIRIRSGLTALVMALAFAGFLRLWRRGNRDLRPALLLISPFCMVPVNSYGGEMLMRSTLFALPFAAYYIAALLLPLPSGRRARVGPITAGMLALSLVLVTARFGNASFDMFTRAEIAGVDELYRLAQPGALLIAGAHPTPWKYDHYADFKHHTLTDLCEPPIETEGCYELVRAEAVGNEAGAMILFNRASRESMRVQGDLTTVEFRKFERMVRRSGAPLAYENTHVRIYDLGAQPGRRHDK